MANPLNAGLGAIGIGSTIFGSLTQAAGAQAAGQAQEQTNQFLGTQSFYNSEVATQNASLALQQGESEAQKYGMGAAQRLGQIKVSQASSGLDVNSGSALQVQKSQQLVSDIDLEQIRSNAAKTAYNFDVQSIQDKNQGQMYFMAGSNAAQAGTTNATSSIISGAGSVASKWLQSSQSGTFNLGL